MLMVLIGYAYKNEMPKSTNKHTTSIFRASNI